MEISCPAQKLRHAQPVSRFFTPLSLFVPSPGAVARPPANLSEASKLSLQLFLKSFEVNFHSGAQAAAFPPFRTNQGIGPRCNGYISACRGRKHRSLDKSLCGAVYQPFAARCWYTISSPMALSPCARFKHPKNDLLSSCPSYRKPMLTRGLTAATPKCSHGARTVR